jgi:hypothetical protein
MTDVSSLEHKARQALNLFRSLGLKAGNAVSPRKLVIVCSNHGWDGLAIADGLEHGLELGWFEDTGMIKLTKQGFAAIQTI